MKKEKWLPVCAGVTVSLFFGMSFMFTKDALDTLAPVQLLGFRFALAALSLTLLRITGLIKINLAGKKFGSLLTVALFQPVLYFIFETIGVNLTTASEAGMMMGLIPVMVVLLEIPFFKTIPSLKQLAAVLLSVAGVFFIVLMKGNVELGYNVWGTLALLGAVISGALYNVLSKKSTLSFSAVEITYIMMWTGAIVFNGFELMRRVVNGSVGQMLVPLADGHVLLAMLYLGVLSSVLAFFLMNYMLSKMGASQTATYINLTTVVSIVAGVLLRGESFAWYQGVGAVMIVLGVWGSSYYGRAVATATLTQQSNVIAVETK